MNARLCVGEAEVVVDLSSPVSIGLELDFQTPQPQHFDAPPATSQPYAVPGFSGSVATGASCNCEVITLIPHCNGTHTECAGHLTREPLDAHRVVPAGFVPALLISVKPVAAKTSGETSDPPPREDDLLVTRSAIECQWPRESLFEPQALVIRTATAPSVTPPVERAAAQSSVASNAQPTTAAPRPPPYLSREAASVIVERGIQHLVIDLPSIDREHDGGRLTAHHLFFGLPPGVSSLLEVTRPRATVTELASIPSGLADGLYLLELQVPAWRGDAVPSRPLLYAFHGALQSPVTPGRS